MHNSYSRTLCYLVSSRENKQLLVYGPVAYQILKTSPWWRGVSDQFPFDLNTKTVAPREETKQKSRGSADMFSYHHRFFRCPGQVLRLFRIDVLDVPLPELKLRKMRKTKLGRGSRVEFVLYFSLECGKSKDSLGAAVDTSIRARDIWLYCSCKTKTCKTTSSFSKRNWRSTRKPSRNLIGQSNICQTCDLFAIFDRLALKTIVSRC